MKAFRRLFSQKQATPSSAVAVYHGSALIEPQRTYERYSQDGYQKNVIAYACINEIAGAVASIPWVLYRKGGRKTRTEVTEHPLLDLLKRPNPWFSGATFSQFRTSYYLISGNSFVHAVGPKPKAPPKELWLLRPDMVQVKPGAMGTPTGYTYRVLGREYFFPCDVLGGSAVLHSRTFNPLSEWLGMSPLSAAAYAIDRKNAGDSWNLGLLKNGARPSIGISMNVGEGVADLTEAQSEQLKKDLLACYQGPANAGKPMVLPGGVSLTPFGFSPQDMDFMNSDKCSASDVCRAFRVPPQVLGIEGSQTFSNYEQAQLSFYDGPVLQYKRQERDELNYWLVPAFGDAKLELGFDEDEISALEPRRKERWAKANESDFLTTNEKRELTGYGRYEAGEAPADRIFVPMGVQPIEMAAAEPEEVPVTDTEDVTGTPQDTGESNKPVEDEKPEPENEDDEGGEKDIERGFEFGEGKSFNLRSNEARRRFQRQEQRIKKGYEKRLFAQVKAAFQKERDELASALEGVRPDLAEFTTNNVLERTQKTMRAVLEANLEDVMLAFGKPVLEIGKYLNESYETKQADSRFRFSVRRFLESQIDSSLKKISTTTRNRIQKRLEEAIAENRADSTVTLSLPQVVKAAYGTWAESRAVTISRTEVHEAACEASRSAAKALSLPSLKKGWAASQDDRTRGNDPKDSASHVEMDGVMVGLNEKFQVASHDGVDLMDGPGDKTAPADQRINCRCSQYFTTDEGDE